MLRRLHPTQARLYLQTGTLTALIASVLVAFPAGDQQAKMVGRYQPVTLAAMEGKFKGGPDAGVAVIGQPNVAGHRLSTMEIESALVSHSKVAEAAVVGKPDDLRGQAISAFVTLESGQIASEELRQELRAHVVKEIGALARPDDIRFTEALPKTRSGKIMRRLLRELATHGEIKGDVTTLEDFTVIAKLREAEEG